MMAIGIHIGGCSCVCASPSTLWKISCETGDVIWRADRIPEAPEGRGRSTSLDLYHDGTDLWIYESGGIPVEGGNNVTKWKDAGDVVERQWDALAERTDNTDYWDAVRRAEDGRVWWIPPYTGSSLVHDAWQLADADGALVASGNLTLSGPQHLVRAGVWAAPSEGMNIVQTSSSLTAKPVAMRRYDNSFAVVGAAVPTGGNDTMGDFAPINGDPSAGFITRIDAFIGTDQFRTLNTSLAVINFLNDTTIQVVRDGSAGGFFLAANATTLQRRNNATLALDWTATIADGWYSTRPTLARLDSDGNAYIVQGTAAVGSGPATVSKISGGAIEWDYDTTVDSPGFAAGLPFMGMIVDEDRDLLLLFGDAFVIDGEYFQVIALSLGNGELQWSVNLGSTVNVRSVNAGQLYGDHLYVCGDKM